MSTGLFSFSIIVKDIISVLREITVEAVVAIQVAVAESASVTPACSVA